jgi:hypothetical protein
VNRTDRRNDKLAAVTISTFASRAGFALALLWLLLPWVAAHALIVHAVGDADSTEAPADDPGWANVGRCTGWTAVYLGGGWVLTARHVGASDLVLAGTNYPLVEKSLQVISISEETPTDLLLYRIHPEPSLPTLVLSKSTPEIGEVVVMIGTGHGKGKRIKGGNFSGFHWGSRTGMKWGTGTVFEHLLADTVGTTKSFATRFSVAKTRYEAQAAVGDSGGAAFVRSGGRWELAGILLAIKEYEGQPQRSAVYGNHTVIADLSHYREVIYQITGLPEK